MIPMRELSVAELHTANFQYIQTDGWQPPPPPPVVVALPPPVIIDVVPRRENNCCCEYGCFECDSDYSWYSLYGKGAVIVLLLLLMYFIGIAIIIAVVLAYAALWILSACNDDD